MYARSGVQWVSSQAVEPSLLLRHALDEPMLLTGTNHHAAGLDEPFPMIDPTLIADLLAQHQAMRTTDVATQSSHPLTATMWQTMTRTAKEQDDYDALVANAEFYVQHVAMQGQVAPPVAVTQVDWHNKILSKLDDNVSETRTPPNVFGAFYAKNTYLDFTLAPGGQCTWLSVSSGELWVFLIAPTSVNVDAYRKWRTDPDFATLFLPEQVDKCIKCVVRAGASLLLPAGWLFARYAGGTQSCSLFYGYFACTAAMEAQLGVVLLEMHDNALAQHWEETACGGFAIDANAQLWTAVGYYLCHLTIDNHGLVNDLERRALQRALPRLKEWSALPASRTSRDKMAWTPTSQHEAHTMITRLERALEATCVSTQSLDASDVRFDSTLSPISPNAATYIYSAASLPDAVSEPLWASTTTSFTSPLTTPMDSIWPSYDPIPHHFAQYQEENLVTLTPNTPFLTNESRFSTSSPSETLQEYVKPDNQCMPTSVSPYDCGYKDCYSLDNAANHSFETLSADNHSVPRHLTEQNVDPLLRHRASCHRCGNLRKTTVQCPVCPHIFCAKCAEKMREEHGSQIFQQGCPVCKEVCCCGKNRSRHCTRKFHCYKKCPSTKRPAFG